MPRVVKELIEESWDVMKTILHMAVILFVAGFTIIGVTYLFFIFVHFVHPGPIFPETVKQECKCHA